MKFIFTPDEAQSIALAVAKHYKRHKMRVVAEKAAWTEAPARTTLVASAKGLSVLIEAQSSPHYGETLKKLVQWTAAQRCYSEIYLATSTESELQLGVLEDIKKDGVGLLTVGESGQVSVSQVALNPALKVMPDPTLTYGPCKSEVLQAIKKFNEVNRKDGLRDMCELVERETESLAVLMINKGRIKIPKKVMTEDKDWSDQINALASSNSYNSPYQPVISDSFKTDLHSFRGARNLVDHKVKGKRDDVKRQKQFAERMMQGPRILSELISIKRKVR